MKLVIEILFAILSLATFLEKALHIIVVRELFYTKDRTIKIFESNNKTKRDPMKFYIKTLESVSRLQKLAFGCRCLVVD